MGLKLLLLLPPCGDCSLAAALLSCCCSPGCLSVAVPLSEAAASAADMPPASGRSGLVAAGAVAAAACSVASLAAAATCSAASLLLISVASCAAAGLGWLLLTRAPTASAMPDPSTLPAHKTNTHTHADAPTV